MNRAPHEPPPSPGPARPGRAGRGPRARRLTVAALVAAGIVVLGLIAWPLLNRFGVFSDKGDRISFSRPAPRGSATGSGPSASVDAGTRLPTGPEAEFTVESTLPDGTKIAHTTLHGPKSGFTGPVWVWAPKEYTDDPRYARSGFPVLIALPGGEGAQQNYWMGADLGLQTSIARWAGEGKSLPFVVVMPSLNPDKKFYRDGSDIPGQPKMGTWLTEDVPDLVRQNFRTLRSRDGWAFMGSSSGGFAGLKSVLQHPDRFKAAIASGPDIVPDSPLWAGHEAERRENDPQVLAQRIIDRGGPDVYLAFQVGTLERGAMRAAKQFVAAYGKGPVHTSLREIPGGRHNAHTYVPAMGEGPIQYISAHLRGPVPSS
ncbi:alpha/beta hydrolase-fold protein [Streptomyces sp. NPDC049577]|uniref:alpha/beta hydrolase n=1 Tax=Streptomyces sp. NPDC049577 TaxID=3155153 RepID=UPI00342E1E84